MASSSTVPSSASAAAAASGTVVAGSPSARIVGPSPALAGTSQLPRLRGAAAARRWTASRISGAAPISSSGASPSSSSIAHQSASAGTIRPGRAAIPVADVGPGAQDVARPDEQGEPSLTALEGLA